MEEERKLKKWKAEIEKAALPEERLEAAIQNGFEHAKTNRRKKWRVVKRSVFSTVSAAILILAFAALIRVSPAFANAIASFPGMERIVEMIQDNKGLQMAIENDHFQVIDSTDSTENVEVTLKGIITDESSLVAFIEIKYKTNEQIDFVSDYRILDVDGKDAVNVKNSSSSYHDEDGADLTSIVEIEFNEPLPLEQLLLEVQFTNDTDRSKITETVRLPFQVQLQPVKKEQIKINETAIVEGQTIKINSITVGSIKTAVEVEYAPENTKKIFGFEDLRIVDENGEEWASIKNGITARYTEDPNKVIYYLQSNYFQSTDELYLEFNKLMALDKEEAFIVIHTETEEILQQPKDKRFSNVKMHGSSFMEVELQGGKDYYHDPFSTFYDAEGKKLRSKSGSFSRVNDKKVTIGVELPNEDFANPLEFPLHAYPTYIKGDVRVKIK